MTRSDWQKIESLLASEVEHARAAFQAAKANLRESTNDIPSEIPHPDGVHRIQRAGTEFHAAMAAYAIAIREFNDFLIDKCVPDRLKQTGTQSGSNHALPQKTK